ncbi:MAG TPA: hypothetical protein VIZ44_03045 [Gaiellaceae bacterium]|jgi:hypothetical protein
MLKKRTISFIAASAAALVFAVTAQASSKQLWYSARVDQIAGNIAGKSVQVLGEDDWNEWASFLPGEDPRAVLGFTYPLAGSSSVLYHKIFINPDLWPMLSNAAVSGAERSGSSRYMTAVAIMSLTHEAYHQRLISLDESRVNACALKAFPEVLSREFGVQPTVTTSNSVPSQVRIRYRVRYHHRWVYRYRWKTVWRSVTSTAPNSVFNEYVADAQDFYSHQPPPYNAGTCW